MNADTDSLLQLHKHGLDILVRELNPVGMIRFILQFSKGSGDYTREKYEREDTLTIEEIVEQAQKMSSRRKEFEAKKYVPRPEDDRWMTPIQLQRAGIDALTKELGPDETARFLEYLEHGEENPCT